MSSENRLISSQALLNEVPPLKTKCFATSISKITASVYTTHQSFSTAYAGMPVLVLICWKIFFFSPLGMSMNLIFGI